MASGLFSTARELPRLREISSVLVRHGLGELVRRAGIATLLEQAGQVLQWGEASEIAQLEPHQREARVRAARADLRKTWPGAIDERTFYRRRGPLNSPGCTVTWRQCRSMIFCRWSNKRSAGLRLRYLAISSANPTPAQSRRYTGLT